MTNTWIELNPPEEKRTYIYKNAVDFKLVNVTKIKISSSGTHYLETKDGFKYIVPSGWIAIEILTPTWTF